MDATLRSQIGARLRAKREQSKYTREKLGEICSLSPRFIANIELGDSAFSLDSLMILCKTLSCSSDYILFGKENDECDNIDVISKIKNIDPKYQKELDKMISCFIETIIKAERR